MEERRLAGEGGVEHPGEVLCHVCSKKNLEFSIISTVVSLMCSGEWSTQVLLRSAVIVFDLSPLRDRLLPLHHSARCPTSSLYPDASLLLMRPIAVGSLANLMMFFEVNFAAKS